MINHAGEGSLCDLHKGYWLGKFERGGRSCVECVPPGLDEPREATRGFVSGWIGWGSPWIPAEIRNAIPGPRQWRAMARIGEDDFYDLAPWWLRTFGRFTIPERDLETWMRRRRAAGADDPVRRKIELVMRGAAQIARRDPQMSRRAIATQLAEEGRAQGYGFESLRKILSGTLPAQIDRDIPGLTIWIERRG